ncbi:MAG: hypothetical protein PHO92_03705 [Candidatus Peribacteraceae bacterium]|nr:hypothetical protein [Candidatus Peribacteraceae bacterium]
MAFSLLDLVFPKRSLTGAGEGMFFTEEDMRVLGSDPVCEECGALRRRGLHSIDCIRAAMPYHASSLVKKAVHTLKYRRIPGVAEHLGGLLAEGCSSSLPPSSVLCPVPLHWIRRFWRGFNQAELLATVAGERTGLPVQRLLRRARPTGSQARRNRCERLTALAGAFRVCAAPLPRCVVLIDDLATTGATLDACAVALKEAGVQRVEGWVIAHG